MNESVNEPKTEDSMTLGGAPTLTACVDAALSLESRESTANLMNETEAKRSESSNSALGEE